MAEFITQVFDILTSLFSIGVKLADSIRFVGDDLDSLKNASNKLNDMYHDVKKKVESAEQDPNPELKTLDVVKGWIDRVEVLQNEVKAILQQGDQEIRAKCFGGLCPKNCWARYKLQKVVRQKMGDVNVFIREGHFEVVAETFACDRFDELPVDKAVGVESTFEELCSCFEDNQVRTIGLYGMGGVGKTTLLKKFNNDFLSKVEHDVVLWIVASKDVDPQKIQDAIRKKLRVQDDIWNNKAFDERVILLYNILIKRKKFVLLLDDVWERIDLLKLGVPSPNKHDCKIIFTTRLENICSQMEAQRHIKVNCLSPVEASDLFREKVGENTLENPHIFDLAKLVVEECQGLPLALCTVGRTMANKVAPNEWKRTIEILRSYPSKVHGIVEDVFYLLEFSYDRLPDCYKSCFLYCALFPEDYSIRIEELILLWIAEGFLTEFDYDIHEARKQGEYIISNLKYSCLLENGEEDNTIKMHDVIRDMALWIACDHGKKTRFFVRDGFKTSGLQRYNHTKWKELEKLSMWHGDGIITNLSQKPNCPNLVTLLVRNTKILVFPTEVFLIPSTIRVLDLSSSRGIRNLPSTIGDLVNLKHMNISCTDIRKLPVELRNLKKLRFLLLDEIVELEFPREVISSLICLQAFSMRFWSVPVINENLLLHELEGLDNLQEIRISVSGKSFLERILMSSKLLRCICELFVKELSLLPELFSSLVQIEHLETLTVASDIKPKDYEVANIPRRSFWGHGCKIILRRLTLIRCHNIVDLNWLVHAPNLEVLQLMECHSLEEIISENFGTDYAERVRSNFFRSLTYLHLTIMSNLRSICPMALQFPNLKEIQVLRCPSLKKLPFNSQSGLKNLRCFAVDSESLDQFQWEDEVTKHLLSSKYEKTTLIDIYFKKVWTGRGIWN